MQADIVLTRTSQVLIIFYPDMLPVQALHTEDHRGSLTDF